MSFVGSKIEFLLANKKRAYELRRSWVGIRVHYIFLILQLRSNVKA